MKRAAKGFAATELAVLIGILGIVGGYAYPRYVALEAEVQRSLVWNLGSNIRSSAHMAHFQWLALGRPASIEFEGRSIAMVNGYPDETSIDDTLTDLSGFEVDTDAIANFRKIDASTPDSCMVGYANATVDALPTIRVITSGC